MCGGSNNQNPVVAVFDFDGTLIDGDSFLILSRAYTGTLRFLSKVLLCSPWLVSWKLGIITNGQAKQRLFSTLYRDRSIEEFRDIAATNIALLKARVRENVFDKLKYHIARGDRVYIVTAGFGTWLKPLFTGLGIKGIISTGVEVDAAGRLTGRFCTPNCYGSEKVRRLLEVEPDRDSYTLVAYGDSDGDREMMTMADTFIKV